MMMTIVGARFQWCAQFIPKMELCGKLNWWFDIRNAPFNLSWGCSYKTEPHEHYYGPRLSWASFIYADICQGKYWQRIRFGKQKAKDSLAETVAAGSQLRRKNEKYNKSTSLNYPISTSTTPGDTRTSSARRTHVIRTSSTHRPQASMSSAPRLQHSSWSP